MSNRHPNQPRYTSFQSTSSNIRTSEMTRRNSTQYAPTASELAAGTGILRPSHPASANSSMAYQGSSRVQDGDNSLRQNEPFANSQQYPAGQHLQQQFVTTSAMASSEKQSGRSGINAPSHGSSPIKSSM